MIGDHYKEKFQPWNPYLPYPTSTPSPTEQPSVPLPYTPSHGTSHTYLPILTREEFEALKNK